MLYVITKAEIFKTLHFLAKNSLVSLEFSL